MHLNATKQLVRTSIVVENVDFIRCMSVLHTVAVLSQVVLAAQGYLMPSISSGKPRPPLAKTTSLASSKKTA